MFYNIFQKKYIPYYILWLSILLWLGIFFMMKLREKKIFDNEYKENINKIDDINETIDKELIWNNDIDNFSGRTEKTEIVKDIEIDLSIFSGDIWWVSLDDLRKAYYEANTKWEDTKQLNILENMYKITEVDSLLYIMIDKAISVYDFQNALKYIKILYAKKQWLDKLTFDTFMYVMINSLELNEDHIKDMESILNKFYGNNFIPKDQYDYYKALLSLSTIDIDSFKTTLFLLPDNKYTEIKKHVNAALNQFGKYKDSPQYYLYWLLSYTFFQHWYFNISQRLANEALQYNQKYILPLQVLAYSNFIWNNHEKAKEYFKKLLELDWENSDSYKFYLWISQYWAGNYTDCIVFLSQIKSGDYYKDSLRYLILAYDKIDDKKNMMNVFEQLSNQINLLEYDYYVFFDKIFYEPWTKKQWFDLYKQNTELTLKYLESCIETVNKKNIYICGYGRWWTFVANWDNEKALKYLLYLTKYYSRDYLFQKIADLYNAKWDLSKAKEYYIKAVIYSESEDTKKQSKDNLLKVIIQLKK